MRSLLLSILFILMVSLSFGQVTIKGKVVDVDNTGIPFATVFLKGTTSGVTTDLDGLFRFSFEASPKDTLIFSSLSYNSDTFSVRELQDIDDIFIILKPKAIFLNEVVVKGGKRNPSFAVMDSVWNRKEKNSMKQLLNYQCQLYSKLELDLYNINKERFDSKMLKTFSFVLDFIDSTGETSYLPLFLTENVSDYYLSNDPFSTYSHPVATKISGVKDENLSPILGKMYQNIDIYENYFDILNKTFVSPLNDKGHNTYKYYIMDSVNLDEGKLYKMEFYPKRPQENTFTGEFWYDNVHYAIHSFNMEISKGANVNFVQNVRMAQSFRQEGDLFLLEKDQLVVHFRPTKKSVDLIGRKTDSYKDYIINSPQIQQRIADRKQEKRKETTEFSDSEWQKLRHDSLSSNETFIYNMVDTLLAIPKFKNVVKAITFISSGYAKHGPIDWGPWYSAISRDSIEQWRFRLGFKTNQDFSKKIRFSTYGAYGVRDQAFKYGAKGEFVISQFPWRKLTIDYMDDLDLENDGADEMDDDNIFALLIRKPLPWYHIHLIKKRIKYDFEWSDHFSSTTSFLQQNDSPYFDFQFHNSEDQLQTTFSNTQLSMSLRFAYNEKSHKTYYRKRTIGTKFPILQIDYSKGLKDVLEGGFSYDKVEFSIRDKFPVGALGKTRYIAKAGHMEGDVPYLLLFIPQGNATFYFQNSSYNSMNPYEFVSDQYASLYLTHHFDGLLLNHVPLIKKLKWRLFLSYKGFAGRLSDANRLKIERDGAIPVPLHNQLYSEAGAGIENIFKFFKVDVIYRISDVANPRFTYYPVAVYGSLQFKF